MKLVSIAAAAMLLFGAGTAQAQTGAPTLADVNADACGVFATASKMAGLLTDTKSANYYDLRTTIVSFRGWAVMLREHKPGAKLLTYMAKIEGLANVADQGAKVMLAKLPSSGKITVGDFKWPMTTIVEAFKTVSEDPLYDGCGKSSGLPKPSATPISTSATDSDTGESQIIEDYTITLIKVEEDKTYIGTAPNEGNRFVSLELLIESGADEGVNVNMFYGNLKDVNGYSYDPIGGKEPRLAMEHDLMRGGKARGWITFEIPKTAMGLVFYFKPPGRKGDLRFEFKLGNLGEARSDLEQLPNVSASGETALPTPRPVARPTRRPLRPTATVPPVVVTQPTLSSQAPQPTARPDDPTKVPEQPSQPKPVVPASPPTSSTEAPPSGGSEPTVVPQNPPPPPAPPTEAAPPPKFEATVAPSP